MLEGIEFDWQSQIDSFQINYPGCTEILGDVEIYGYDITNLNGLSVLTSFGGDLYIDGSFTITSLSGLENVSYIGGDLDIRDSDVLENLSGIDSINSNTISHLRIYDNDILSHCEVQSVCDYLKDPNAVITIDDNTDGCDNIYQVELACGLVSIDDPIQQESISFFPNPFTTTTTIEIDLSSSSYIQLSIYNAFGQKVENLLDQEMPSGTYQINWSPGFISPGLYYAVLRTQDYITVVKIVKQ